MGDASGENRQAMSCGLYIEEYDGARKLLDIAFGYGYHYIVTKILKNDYKDDPNVAQTMGVNDRDLRGIEWNRNVVARAVTHYKFGDELVEEADKKLFEKEIDFAAHLGVSTVWIELTTPHNLQLAAYLNHKLQTQTQAQSVWINIPMVHSSRNGLLGDEEHDTWDWWNSLRSQCNYHRLLYLALELCDVDNMFPVCELNRWIGEPVRALIIPSSYFLLNQYGKPVLSRVHQDIIKRFMPLDVQFVIKENCPGDLAMYNSYIHFLGKKLYNPDVRARYVQGCEDFIQDPLQPLSSNLDTNIYEIFETDNVKYDVYKKAIYKALEEFDKDTDPVVMVLGAGRGPLVQAVLEVAKLLEKKLKIYAVEKNPFAVNTLAHKVEQQWGDKVVLVHQDMRYWNPPEKADIIISELLGSFGDNELSPECLDGAQRFLKPDGISIPKCYTSYIAPIQNFKVYNMVRSGRHPEKSLQTLFETPYVCHLTNNYFFAPPQELFKFTHPNWERPFCNRRYKKLQFRCEQSCILTAFAGYFDTDLYKDVNLSIHPETHTADLVSWFPIIFSIPEPVQLNRNSIIEVSFWREENEEKVWYEWCLHSPVPTQVFNSGGRSFFMKKH